MKIEFEEAFGNQFVCTFSGGSQLAIVEETYTKEEYGSVPNFFGELATKALEKALEQERRETAEKICKDILNENKFAITNYIAKLDPLPKRIADYGKWKVENPYVPARGSGKSVYIRRSLSPVIEKVIFNSPATIVFWSDGDKTVVKANKELFDREKGLAMAIAKKFLGNKGNYFETFKKYIK